MPHLSTPFHQVIRITFLVVVLLSSLCVEFAHGTCSVSNTHLPVAETGRLQSDPDNIGKKYTIGEGEFCLYSVTCPSEFAFASIAVDAILCDGDSLTIRNEDRSFEYNLQGKKETYYRCETFAFKKVFPLAQSKKVHVLLADGKPLTSGRYDRKPRGFNLRYRCRNDYCASGTPRVANDGTVVASVNAEINDFLPYNTVPNERCTWLVTCPAGHATYALIQSRQRSHTSSGGSWRVMPELSDGTGVTLAKGGKTTTTPKHGISVERSVITIPKISSTFQTPTLRFEATSAPDVSNFGVNFLVTCSNTKCQSPKAGRVLRFDPTDPKRGTTEGHNYVTSDKDGWHRVYRTLPEEQCNWEIKCDVGQRVMLTWLRMRTNKKTVLSMYDSRLINETLLVSANVSDIPPQRLIRRLIGREHKQVSEYLLPTNHATLLLDATGDGVDRAVDYLDAGLSFHYWCSTVSPPDSTPAPGTTLKDRVGSIKSDPDGVGTGHTRRKEAAKAEWVIACPLSSTFHVRLNISYSFPYNVGQGDDERSDTNNQEVHLGLRGSGSAAARSKPHFFYKNSGFVQLQLAAPVEVMYNVGRTDWAIDGFTLDYECTETQCSSSNSSLQLTSQRQEPLSPPQRIVVGGPAQGDSKAALEVCEWHFRCPAATPFMTFTAKGSWATGNVRLVHQSPLSVYDTVTITPKAYSDTAPTHFLQTPIGSTAELMLNMSKADKGAMLDFGCSAVQCEAATAPGTRFTTTTGTIDTRTSSGLTGVNQRCKWHVECPSFKVDSETSLRYRYTRAVFTFSGRAPLNPFKGVYLHAVSEGGSTTYKSKIKFGSLAKIDTETISDQHNFIVGFDTDVAPVAVSPSPTIHYTCEYASTPEPTQPAPTTATPVSPSKSPDNNAANTGNSSLSGVSSVAEKADGGLSDVALVAIGGCAVLALVLIVGAVVGVILFKRGTANAAAGHDAVVPYGAGAVGVVIQDATIYGENSEPSNNRGYNNQQVDDAAAKQHEERPSSSSCVAQDPNPLDAQRREESPSATTDCKKIDDEPSEEMQHK